VLNVNDAPTAEGALPDLDAREDEPFTCAIPDSYFTDQDANDRLTYHAALADGAPLPGWLAFDSVALAFSGMPLQSDVGPVEVRVTATDTSGSSIAEDFRITVLNVNDAPIVASPIPEQAFEAGTRFSFAIPAATFADEDGGDRLSLAASRTDGSVLPAWLSFNAAEAVFTGEPQLADIGVSSVRVTATDRDGARVAADFGLVVQAPAGSRINGSWQDDLLYGGTGNEKLKGKGGNDALFGEAGNDILQGGRGQDVLQGGAGSDVLFGGAGPNLLDGGAGNDALFGGNHAELIAGGAGNDVIRTGGGADVILFNRGDGADTVISHGRGDNTLSFGGGIRYSDLSLSRQGKDLVVHAGADDRVTLKNWYAGHKSVLNLQIVLDAASGFDRASADALFNRQVQVFDFQGMVDRFEQARKADRTLTSWDISNALLQFHLSGMDDAALGGDLAYWYARNNALAGISISSAQQIIGAAGFGSDAQSLRPFSGLQEGFAKLR
jgi:hypothetical protein